MIFNDQIKITDFSADLAPAAPGGLFGAPPPASAFGQPAPAPAFGAPAPTAGGLFGSPGNLIC